MFGHLAGRLVNFLVGSFSGLFDFDRPTADRLLLDPTTGEPTGR